jgi:uncharacterized membrane protein
MASQYLIHLALGPLILILGIIFRLFPPKNINYIYGYRTPRSMSNQKIWDFSNRYASNILIYASTVCIVVQLFAILLFPLFISIIIGAVAMCIAAISVLPFTEYYISQNFDDTGNKVKS